MIAFTKFPPKAVTKAVAKITPRSISIFEKAYDIPVKTKGLLRDFSENNRNPRASKGRSWKQ